MNNESSTRMEAEAQLLSCLIQHPHLINECDLQSSVFSMDSYQTVYSTILEQNALECAIDAVSLADSLESKDGKNWLGVTAQLAARFATVAMFPSYVGIVRRESRRAAAIEIANKLIGDSSESSAVDDAISSLMKLGQSRKNHEHTITQVLRASVEELEKAHEAKGATGIQTGIMDIDEKLGGLHSGDLVVIGARPAHGKTALALNMISGINDACGLISSEQGAEQVGQRFIAIRGSVSVSRMRNGSLKDEDFAKVSGAVEHFQGRVVMVNDQPGIDYLEIISQARKWKHNHGIKALFIDYLQRIKHPEHKKPKHEQVADMVQAFKELARELDIPVVVLSQVVRGVDQRPDQRPLMGDLANSSEIEREADQIITLYRDEVANDQTEQLGVAELVVRKNRHGPTGLIRLSWTGEYTRFADLETKYYDYQAA